jgi:hypothetical protein
MAAAGMLNEVATQSFTYGVSLWVYVPISRTPSHNGAAIHQIVSNTACDCDPLERKYLGLNVSIDGSEGTTISD